MHSCFRIRQFDIQLLKLEKDKGEEGIKREDVVRRRWKWRRWEEVKKRRSLGKEGDEKMYAHTIRRRRKGRERETATSEGGREGGGGRWLIQFHFQRSPQSNTIIASRNPKKEKGKL